jgi:hypothetical protein
LVNRQRWGLLFFLVQSNHKGIPTMAVTVTVGLQKKIGLPAYGSLCASCSLEVEVDSGLLEHTLEQFHEKIAYAYEACRQAIEKQLAVDHQATHADSAKPEPALAARNGSTALNRGAGPQNGSNAVKPSARTNGQQPEVATITQSQLRAIHAISRRSRVDPAVLVRERFQLEGPEYLTIRQASSLIDELKSNLVEVQK